MRWCWPLSANRLYLLPFAVEWRSAPPVRTSLRPGKLRASHVRPALPSPPRAPPPAQHVARAPLARAVLRLVPRYVHLFSAACCLFVPLLCTPHSLARGLYVCVCAVLSVSVLRVRSHRLVAPIPVRRVQQVPSRSVAPALTPCNAGSSSAAGASGCSTVSASISHVFSCSSFATELVLLCCSVPGRYLHCQLGTSLCTHFSSVLISFCFRIRSASAGA